LKQRDLSCKW